MLLVAARSLEPDARGFGTHEQFGLKPCYFQKLTGKVCPLCGGTTAWAHALRGEVTQAANANFAAMLLCAGVAIGSLQAIWIVIRGQRPQHQITSRLLLLLASAWLAVAVFDWLRKVLL